MSENGWRVLVVEDTYDDVQVVSKILHHHGIEVHVASNGIECLRSLETFEPTFVVMDLSMPTMDGWETLVQMRTNPDTAHIPVVAITAYHSAEVAQDASLAGFDAYFPKPISPTQFVQDIAEILGF
jgi:CheY-like chemotaxis protein